MSLHKICWPLTAIGHCKCSPFSVQSSFIRLGLTDCFTITSLFVYACWQNNGVNAIGALHEHGTGSNVLGNKIAKSVISICNMHPCLVAVGSSAEKLCRRVSSANRNLSSQGVQVFTCVFCGLWSNHKAAKMWRNSLYVCHTTYKTSCVCVHACLDVRCSIALPHPCQFISQLIGICLQLHARLVSVRRSQCQPDSCELVFCRWHT